MKDLNVAHYVATQLWAIMPGKLQELLGVLAYHAAGHRFSAEEIQARIGAASGPAQTRQAGAVAVLPLRGVVAHRMGSMHETSGGTSTERFTAQYRALMQDDAIAAVILDVDSPGGTVAGVPELVSEMQALKGRKPVVAVANSLMASAAYWIASQADEIVVTPSGSVGSIGVFTAHQDLSKKLEAEGINVTLISAGKYKTEGNPFAPLDEEARAVVQARVDDAYDQFVKAVAKGRGASPGDVRDGYGQGRVLPAKEALAAGMVDRIATLDETIARMTTTRGRNAVATGVRADADPAPVLGTFEPVGDWAKDGETEIRGRRLNLA